MWHRQNNTYGHYLFVAAFILMFAACTNSSSQTQTEIVEEPEQMNDAVMRNLTLMLAHAKDNDGKLYDSVRLNSLASVVQFYKSGNHQGVWSSNEELLPVADSLLNFVRNCKRYGLFPQDYHEPQLQQIHRLFVADTLSSGSRKDAILWTRLDLMLTDAFITIAKHLHKGRLHTDSIYKNFDSTLGHEYYHTYLNEALKQGVVTSVLSKLEPKHKAYYELKKALPPFLDSADFSKQFTFLNYPYKDSVAFVKTLIKRFREEQLIDTSVKRIDSAVLAQIIKKVQKQRNLTVDGKFGNQLVSSLNSTDAEKFYRIAINLDRYKLMPDTMPRRYIWVNLPAYTLQVIDDDTVAIESRVVVGKSKTRTPLLTSAISDMVTYPQWTIPNSIIIKEILPALKRNPGYLARKGYNLFTWHGDPVDPYSVNWAKYSKGIPYKIVQGSGDANALGIMKFNFPNKYSVYLHDTNQRYLFKNENRSLSHGCVRVQQWEQLVWYIHGLDSVASVNAGTRYLPSDSIRNWLARKEKHVIPVKTKLPVYFRYFTAAGKNGKLVFYNDVYNEDRQAREAYFSSK